MAVSRGVSEVLELGGLLAAFVRFSAFLFALPLFGSRSIPVQARIGLAALLALLVFPPLPEGHSSQELFWFFVVLQEAVVGLLLGFIVVLVFGIIYFAGQLTDVPMGFGMVNLFDPGTGMQLPVFSSFYHLLASLVFFAIDGHLWLFQALLTSYEVVPVGGTPVFENYFLLSMDVGQKLFSLGLQIALPIMGTVFLSDMALAIVIRIVPQINVFVIGFPIKILLGTFVLVFVMPVYVTFVGRMLGWDGFLYEYFYALLQSMGGR